MNTQQAILKCNKKAWKEIKHIRNAKNMLEVESAVSNAVQKTFGLWDRGVLIVGMRKVGQMGVLECRLRAHRSNWDRHISTVRAYLIDQVPARFFHTVMYKKLISGVGLNQAWPQWAKTDLDPVS